MLNSFFVPKSGEYGDDLNPEGILYALQSRGYAIPHAEIKHINQGSPHDNYYIVEIEAVFGEPELEPKDSLEFHQTGPLLISHEVKDSMPPDYVKDATMFQAIEWLKPILADGKQHRISISEPVWETSFWEDRVYRIVRCSL